MAQYKEEALVLGTHNWGEADRMVTLFTRSSGKLKAVAFGCRRPRSPLAAGMQMFSHVEVQLQNGMRLPTVKQCALLHRYPKLSEHLETMAYGTFVAEMVREFLPEHVPDEAVFDLLLEIFEAFEKRNPRITALAAAWQLLEHSGLQLHFERCVHCGKEIQENSFFDLGEGGILCWKCRTLHAENLTLGVRNLIRSLRDMDWKKEKRFILKRDELLAAEKILLTYLQQTLGHPMKSLQFLQQLS